MTDGDKDQNQESNVDIVVIVFEELRANKRL